jgi:cell shape-determining protein MreC
MLLTDVHQALQVKVNTASYGLIKKGTGIGELDL